MTRVQPSHTNEIIYRPLIAQTRMGHGECKSVVIDRAHGAIDMPQRVERFSDCDRTGGLQMIGLTLRLDSLNGLVEPFAWDVEAGRYPWAMTRVRDDAIVNPLEHG